MGIEFHTHSSRHYKIRKPRGGKAGQLIESSVMSSSGSESNFFLDSSNSEPPIVARTFSDFIVFQITKGVFFEKTHWYLTL